MSANSDRHIRLDLIDYGAARRGRMRRRVGLAVVGAMAMIAVTSVIVVMARG